jgi:serpin B
MNYFMSIVKTAFIMMIILTQLSCSSGLSNIPGSTFITASVSNDTNPSASAEDIEKLVEANNLFAFDMYKILSEKNENVFFSPFSLSQVLAMTWTGASGNTSKQMSDTLHYSDMDPSAVNAAFNRINSGMKSSGSSEIRLLNSIWAQKDEPWKGEFLEVLKKNYDSGIYEADFSGNPGLCLGAMNDWVKTATRGKIKESFNPSSFSDLVRVCLLNVIYLKGEWVHKFKKSLTQMSDFFLLDQKSTRVLMMRQPETKYKCLYSGRSDTYGVEMPYRDCDLAMFAVSPPTDKFAEFESQINLEKWDEMVSELKERKIVIEFPKLTSYFDLDMKKILQDMGISDAFIYETADFTNMNGKMNLFISDVLQKTYLQIDEEGTIAIVFSGINVKAGGVTALKFNRPFIFAIRDTKTGLILFMGRITDPSKL